MPWETVSGPEPEPDEGRWETISGPAPAPSVQDDSLSGRWAAAAPRREAALEWLPAIGGVVGGGLGAGGGTIFGLGVGAVPGAIGGAALGGAAGEAMRQNLRRVIGAEAPDTSEAAARNIVREGGTQAAMEAGGRVVAGGVRAIGRGMVENAVRPPIGLQREFPDVIDTIVKENLPVGAGVFGGQRGSTRAAALLKEESRAVKALLTRATAGGKTFESSKIAEPVLKLIDDVAEAEALSPGGVKQLERLIDNFLEKKPGPLSPLDVQKLKQAAQSIAKPIYKAIEKGHPVTADQSVLARFNASIAEGSKKAMESVSGRTPAGRTVAQSEARKQSLIGATRALSQAEMRRMSLMGEIGAGVLGNVAGQVAAPLDSPLQRSAAGWLIARGVLSPRALSRSGLILTRNETATILRQFPRLGEMLLSGATIQEPTQEGQAGQ